MEQIPQFSVDIRRYFNLLKSWSWLLILLTVLGALSAYFFSQRAIPIYQATTTLLINEASANQTTDYTAILSSERLAKTYTELITKENILRKVIDLHNLTMDSDELKNSIIVQPINETQLIEIKVEGTDPYRSALIANTIVDVFAEQIQQLQSSRFTLAKENLLSLIDQSDNQILNISEELNGIETEGTDQEKIDRLELDLAQQRQTHSELLLNYEGVLIAEAQSTSNVVQAEAAVPSDEPIRPRVLRNTALASIIGLVIAVGFVFFVNAFDDTIRDPDEIVNILGLPILGLILQHQPEPGKPITISQPRSPVSEGFRSLRTNIQYTSIDDPIQSLVITSPSPDEGKSTVAANLAIVMSQGGIKTALVDADLRRPRVHQTMGILNRKGLTSLLLEPEIKLDGNINIGDNSNLGILTSGKLPPNPSELLGSKKMDEVLRQIKQKTEMIIIDSPPAIAVTDASILSTRADGVLIVLKLGITEMSAARQSVEQLRKVNANIIGVVLNGVDIKKSYYRYYKYESQEQAINDDEN